jgi:predicted Fe-Mo cluster-binding NifX family protein
MENSNIRIAFITDDGVSISRHFGRARYYEVVDVENGVAVKRERREKPGHHSYAGEPHEEGHRHGHGHGHGHGFGQDAQRRHGSMIGIIQDCNVLVAGGMGNGAYENILRANIKPILTSQHQIDQALADYVQGTLQHHPERLH